MKRKALIVFFAILSASLLGGPSVAVAREKVLEFTLVTKAIDVRPIDVANVENQTVGQGRYFGVATFKDGRIAVKDFVFDFDFILSGTGAYAGATGTGSFDRIQSQFKGVGLFNAKLVIVIP
jgi:hypothetical protein